MRKFEDNGDWFKYCPICKIIYPHPELVFGVGKGSSDGLHCYCEGCQNHKNKEWRENNPEKVVENNKKWRENNPEKNRESSKNWVKNNPERKRENVEKWQKNNPERVRENTKKWRERNVGYMNEWRNNHPDKIKEINNKWKQNNPTYYKEWMKTESGKKSKRKTNNKRRSNFGYVELWENNWPEEISIDYHHINNLVVVPIPRITHKRTLGKIHRKDMNEMFKKYYMMDIDEMLKC